jgi:hypothetical protein
LTRQNIWTFVYGSYINVDVLNEVDYSPDRWEVARLYGFELVIAPRANLVRSDRGTVYGIVATSTHDELARLYDHARQILGETYLPEAVLVETADGTWRPALCYTCPEMEPRPAEAACVDRVLDAVKRYGSPDWYRQRILQFKP